MFVLIPEYSNMGCFTALAGKCMRLAVLFRCRDMTRKENYI